ncbi:hypothetical protein MHL31_05795 [Lutibacter sp. A80]|uniref:SwmB domain-containing protein n=1 Tax=Lutibacter sp. A80 TaxID=2918453 RepID=UPI001F06D286|nr:SwmB domain-containing protein [Lutibacter sp. A80]UMB61716.1 hypothetical protein MHL31_05795 [Lutibacter sp. A80]
MKKILIISLLFLTLGFTIGCEDDYEAPFGDYSSFSWYTGDGVAANFDLTEKQINIDNYIAFYDVSQNAISHKWTIPASCNFLNKEITDKDSIYTPFIIPGTESAEDLANVLFVEPGIQEVVLTNVFKDSVANSSKLSDGSWEIEQKFTVDVFANPNPACEIFKYDYSDPLNPTLVKVLTLTQDQIPSEEEIDSWQTVSIEAGQDLMYVDKSTEGRPTGTKWYLDGGKPETSGGDTAVVKYNKLGEFTSYMESIRAGEEVPKKTISKIIPLKIEVLPSTAPFVRTGKVSITDNVISFSVTGEVAALVQQEDFFTVHVTNETAGFDQNIAVSSAKINSEDATIIELTLAEPVYNTDTITLAYSGGNIVSVDSRVLDDFEPTIVTMDLGSNVLVESWAGFENASSSGNTTRKADCDGYWVGAANDNLGLPFYRTTDKFYEGEASMKYESADGVVTVALQGSDFSKPNGIEAGTYRVSYMVYLEPGNTMKTFTNIIQKPSQEIVWDIENLPRGEWIEISQDITTAAIASGTRFDLKVVVSNNSDAVGLQKMYFDNLSWVKLIPRS